MIYPPCPIDDGTDHSLTDHARPRVPVWVQRYEAARAAEQLSPEIQANAAAYNAMIGDGHGVTA